MRTLAYGFIRWVYEDVLKIQSNDLQTRNAHFCLKCFGFSNTFNKRERAFRFAEEAMELLQAAGVTESEVERILKHVYSKEPGDIRKELANTQLTLLALGNSFSVHVKSEAERDLWWANKNMPSIRTKYLNKPDEIVHDKLGLLLEMATIKAKS